MDAGLARACGDILKDGSKSFHAASRLLPPRLRAAVAGFYAFCRVSDDAIDNAEDADVAFSALTARVDAIFAGAPGPEAADRALHFVVTRHRVPPALIHALLEGYLWDVQGRRYPSLSEVRAYSARVAASVGVVMTLLMGRREPAVLARAADLGVAMQLTNIARDVGEDARNGRVYLPLRWLAAEGVDVGAWLAQPAYSEALGVCICRLLDHADVLYRRADAGVARLPWDCRPAILAARWFYAAIGDRIRARGYDSVSARAFTTPLQKAGALLRGSRLGRERGDLSPPAISWQPPPLPETRFLVEAVSASAEGGWDAWSLS